MLNKATAVGSISQPQRDSDQGALGPSRIALRNSLSAPLQYPLKLMSSLNEMILPDPILCSYKNKVPGSLSSFSLHRCPEMCGFSFEMVTAVLFEVVGGPSGSV